MSEIVLRPMTAADRSEVAETICASINVWYMKHGRPRLYVTRPDTCTVYFDVYHDLTPGANVVAVHPETGRIMGSCFYHPRPTHVGLGIMTVHPNYWASGVGGLLLRHIIDFADHAGLPLRLTQSAINVDSFSLYNRYGFVPRCAFQDMFLSVPDTGLGLRAAGRDRVRDATPADVPAMAAVERDVSGITREIDYRYCIDNARGLWHVSVIESPRGDVDGFMISSRHAAVNMLGPCVARTEEAAIALLAAGFDQHPGRRPVCLVPVEKTKIVRQMYDWGARNSEMHFCQVRGEFRPFQGVSMPSFLPETG